MSIEALFRTLVVGSYVIAMVGGFFDAAVPDALPKSLSDAYEAVSDEYFERLWYITLPLALLCLIGILAATIGLCLFKPWSRPLAVGLTFAAFPLYGLSGPVVQSGWSTMFIETSCTLWGIVLAMAYLSPLNVRFQRNGLLTSSSSGP